MIGICTCITLLITVNKSEKSVFLPIAIIISGIYVISVLLFGSVIFLHMIIKECITSIHNQDYTYFLGFILHYIIIIIITLFIICEHKNLNSLLNFSHLINHNRISNNYNYNYNDEDSNSKDNNGDDVIVGDNSKLLNQEQPPPYYS